MQRYQEIFRVALLAVLVLGIAGCGAVGENTGAIPTARATESPAATETDQNFEDKEWVLRSFGISGSNTQVLPNSQITFLASNGTVKGSTGCNSYQALYQRKRNVLSISSFLVTERACVDPKMMQQEEQFLQGLKAAVMYEMQTDHLVISFDAGHSQLNFTLASP